ncbi:MAG TPA: ornithine carbamoyltransferase, partial [Ruminococcaceae bacterium]|nr:ornithine carbamoyltransferase [Oscillospiraceae bacterium]
ICHVVAVREHKGTLEGLNMCYIGDGNNMANSLIVGCLKVGMHVSVACPADYCPDPSVLEFAVGYGDKFVLTESCIEAVRDADVVFTDVWASMGQESQAEKRRAAFSGYQINNELLKLADRDCMVQHCLPAHRGEEITEEVFEAHANEIFDEAENRLHAQKAVMVTLMK